MSDLIIIQASTTPLKRYSLLCPKCGAGNIYLPAGEPDEPFCNDCDEAIDLEELQIMIEAWAVYLCDRKALLEQEKGAGPCKP